MGENCNPVIKLSAYIVFPGNQISFIVKIFSVKYMVRHFSMCILWDTFIRLEKSWDFRILYLLFRKSQVCANVKQHCCLRGLFKVCFINYIRQHLIRYTQLGREEKSIVECTEIIITAEASLSSGYLNKVAKESQPLNITVKQIHVK